MGRPRKEQGESIEMVEAIDVEQVEHTEQESSGRYLVQWDVKVNGQRYQAGDSVDLNADDAARFLASGAVIEG